jgi:TfoX/Sxy family transcriptional regulator of competence genes
MRDEYDAYKVNHVANLLSSEEGKMILIGYYEMKDRITRNQDLIKSLEDSLSRLNIKGAIGKTL